MYKGKLDFDINAEAFGMLCRILEKEKFQIEENYLRKKGETYRKWREQLGKATEELDKACEDIELPESILYEPMNNEEEDMGGFRYLAEYLWFANYEIGSKEKPEVLLKRNFKETGAKAFLESCFVEGPDVDISRMEVWDIVRLMDFSAKNKYHLLEIAMNPDPFIERLCEDVEKIKLRIEPAIEKWKDIYSYADDFLSKYEDPLQEGFGLKMEMDYQVYPNLTRMNMGFSFEEARTDRSLFQLGILSALKGGESQKKCSEEEIKECMKCFSDSTKWEILKILAENPTYQADIARKLKLTTATISHHMTLLLSIGLIRSEVSVSGKKIIYDLNREKISEVMKETERIFLEHKV